MSVRPDNPPAPLPRRAAWPSARFPLAAGTALALLVLGLCVGMGWWTHRTRLDQHALSSRQRTVLMGRLVAQLASARLDAGDRATLWLELREVALEQGLSVCKVSLPDGRILADGLGPQSVSKDLPLRWDGTPSPLVIQSIASGFQVQLGIAVPNRGPIEVALATTDAGHSNSSLRAEIAAFAALGLLLAGVFTRIVHERFRTLSLLRGAVVSAATRGGSAESLSLSPGLGSDATMWNQLVREMDEMRRADAERVVSERENEGVEETRTGTRALDGLWFGVILLDGARRIQYCNGAASLLLGGMRDSFVGAFAQDVLPEGVASLSRDDAGGAGSAELEITRANQDKTVVRFTSRPLGREADASTMIVMEDVSQQRMADESRNAFVTQATHELRSPLTNMRLYLENLVEEGDSDPAIRSRCLNVLSGAVRRLERVVGDMLSVSEIEAGSLKLRVDDVKPQAIFEELADDFRAQSEDKDISLVFDVPPKMESLQADRDKVVLALHNLIGNALKYTPSGGQVAVRVEQDAGSLQVHVTDNGIGIRQEECDMIFERFYRAKDRRVSGITGSGLGLALSRKIARLHGGDVTVKSVIDRGSTFSLRLPCHPSEFSKAA